MSRRGNDGYDYKEESTASFGPSKRTRRRINHQTNDVQSIESPVKKSNRIQVRNNSNDKYDYNVDESINEDGPTINKNSYVFNPPINEKNGAITSINFQDGINSKQKQSKVNFDNDIDQISPINPRNEFRGDRSKRTSDLVEFQTPNIAGLSPIGHSSTLQKGRNWNIDRNLDMHSSDSSDEAQIVDSDHIRGRNKDISPHNRHARPRSSWIKKEINKEKEVSDQSTPKRVRFHEEVKEKIQPVNLKTRLDNQQFDDNAAFGNEKPQYTKEITRDEFEYKYNQNVDDYHPNTSFGRRLRSQERVQGNDPYVRNSSSQFNNEPAINSTQKSTENKYAVAGRQTPPRSFQLKNVVNNTEYVRKRLPEGTNEKNTTIHEMSSRFEESRDENVYRRPSSIEDRINGRSKSPFNVSQTQNTSIVKEPPRVKQEVVENFDEKIRNPYFYESQPKPISKYFDDRNEIVIKPEVKPYYEEDYYVPKQIKPEVIQRVAPKISVGNLESFENRQSRDDSSNRPVPRDRPLGSPSRAPKPKDSTAELNTLSRFLSNTIVIKTIEDLVFQLVPEFLDEAKNPKTETVVKKNMKGSKREPNFDFEAKDDQSKKDVIKAHNKELLNAVAEMDRQDEANVYDSDDVDEHSHVNRIIESKEKREMVNPYVTSRDVDTLGIKFETNKIYKGIKSVAYHEKGNFIMTDVKSKLSRQVHEVGDVWWADWFDLIKENEQEIHHKACRPFFTSKELIEEKGEFQINDLPYVNEKIFKVSKAITQHLSDVLKTNAGIFDETVEIRFLRILRQKAEDIEKNNRNIKAITHMNDAITQVLDDSKGNSDLYWVFVFAKRLSKLTEEKMDIIEKISKEMELQEEWQNKIRETLKDKSSLRLTTIKDKVSQSINFDDVKSVLMAPYTKETKNDSRFVDLRIKGKYNA